MSELSRRHERAQVERALNSVRTAAVVLPRRLSDPEAEAELAELDLEAVIAKLERAWEKMEAA